MNVEIAASRARCKSEMVDDFWCFMVWPMVIKQNMYGDQTYSKADPGHGMSAHMHILNVYEFGSSLHIFSCHVVYVFPQYTH